MRFHGGNKFFRQTLHLFFEAHADMQRLAFENQFARLIDDAIGEVQPHAFGGSHPDFDAQNIIVASEGFVAQMRFDDGEHEACLLPFEQWRAEAAEELTSRCFKDAKVVGVIDVITNRAIGVGYAVGMDKTLVAHGRSVGGRWQSSIGNCVENAIASAERRSMLTG